MCVPTPSTAVLPRARPAALPPPLANSSARHASLAIGVLLHDSGDRLTGLHALLQQTGGYFARHVILMLENDSADCTASPPRADSIAFPSASVVTPASLSSDAVDFDSSIASSTASVDR